MEEVEEAVAVVVGCDADGDDDYDNCFLAFMYGAYKKWSTEEY